MVCFDFHLTPHGPKLIEINMGCDGYATNCNMYKEFDKKEGKRLELALVNGLIKEYQNSGREGKPKMIVIIDDNLKK